MTLKTTGSFSALITLSWDVIQRNTVCTQGSVAICDCILTPNQVRSLWAIVRTLGLSWRDWGATVDA